MLLHSTIYLYTHTRFVWKSFRSMLKLIPRTGLVAMIPLSNYSLALGALGLAVLGYALFRRKPMSPDEIERKRRVWLTEVGRITDGTVIDVQELPSGARRAATMLIYQYDVAGVFLQGFPGRPYSWPWSKLHYF